MYSYTCFFVVKDGETKCPDCGNELKHYDWVNRVLKTKRGEKQKILVERKYCKVCHKVHRVITEDIIPYKQYERPVIEGVIEGFINEETIGFEDFPSERQMKRWRREENTSFNEENIN